MNEISIISLPTKPTKQLTAAIRAAAESGDVAAMRHLTRVEDDKLARWAALAHIRMQDPGETIQTRMTSRDWLAKQGLRHLLPQHLPADAVRAGFRLNRHGGVA